jgi:hypothetical protein
MTFVRSLIPPPLSPLFTVGGALEGFNEDATLTLAVMSVLACVHAIVSKTLKPKSRWFAIHFVANVIAAAASAPDVYRVFVTDVGGAAWTGKSYSMVANSAIAAVHLYHCVAFSLKPADIVHHVVFVVVLCGLAVPYKNVAGAANNMGCFFLSGLPGGIDFFNLVLKEEGVMGKLAQKKWSARINTWVRGPAMSVYAFVGWQTYQTGASAAGLEWVIFIVCFLHFTNGQYYCAEAVAGYAKWQERERAESRKEY